MDKARESDLLPEGVGGVFDYFGTSDFEFILRLLWQSAKVNRALGIEDLRTGSAYVGLRDSLIESVRAIHPSYDDVREKIPVVYNFIKGFKTVVSLNYDLILYWAVVFGLDNPDGSEIKDCFVRGKLDPNWNRFRDPLRKGNKTTLVFYPHGNLAIASDLFGSEVKVSASGRFLLDAVFDKWQGEGLLPVFVSEGTSNQKKASIERSNYLSTVYKEVLSAGGDSVTIYGWGMGDQDDHIIRALSGSGINKFAISVFDGSQEYCSRVAAKLRQQVSGVEIVFFDSSSAGCWVNDGRG